MNRVIIILALLSTSTFAFAQQKDIDALTKLNKDWIDAYPTKDSATMSRIFADDFNLIAPNGKLFTKKDIVSNLHNQTITSTHIDSVAVRLVTNDVGIVTAYTSFTLTDNGKDVQGKNCYQDVYIKRKGQWFAISAHVTLLSMQ